MLTLRALQSTANSKHTLAPMTWDALNQMGHQYGAPDIDYDRFAARWETDPILKKLVDRFDGHGLVVNTDAKEPKLPQGQKTGMIDRAASAATKRALKV